MNNIKIAPKISPAGEFTTSLFDGEPSIEDATLKWTLPIACFWREALIIINGMRIFSRKVIT